MCEEKKSSVVWRKLFESFDTMDGKPSAADIAVSENVRIFIVGSLVIVRLLRNNRRKKINRR